MKVGLPLLKNVLTPLAKSVLIPLRVTAAEWLACRNAVIHEKILSIRSTLLEMSNKQMGDIIKIAQSPEESDVMIKNVTQTIEKETKEE